MSVDLEALRRQAAHPPPTQMTLVSVHELNAIVAALERAERIEALARELPERVPTNLREWDEAVARFRAFRGALVGTPAPTPSERVDDVAGQACRERSGRLELANLNLGEALRTSAGDLLAVVRVLATERCTCRRCTALEPLLRKEAGDGA